MKPLFGGFSPMVVYCAIRWMADDVEATADGGEVAYLRHAEVGVEENPGTLRCALHTGLWKSAVALRRESANRPCVDVYNRSSAVFSHRADGCILPE